MCKYLKTLKYLNKQLNKLNKRLKLNTSNLLPTNCLTIHKISIPCTIEN